MSEPSPEIVEEARVLLGSHADRRVTGEIEDPAVLAAVVGVERVLVALGGADPAAADLDRIRAALAGDAPDPHVRGVVADVELQVVEGIENREVGDSLDASSLNPDAGGYEIVTDATLVRAGVRAAQRSYDAMPYYRIRYGDRGSRFASTDSGWLLSLARHEEAHAVRQVRWLSRVLATHGMPSWLLETHVALLAAEVGAVVPDGVGTLPAGAAALAGARREHVDDDLVATADEWAEQALGDDAPVPRTGLLVATAVADVLAGVRTDDEPVLAWLTDPRRVGPDVAAGIREVRERVRHAAR